MAGKIISVNVKPGDVVKEDDVLLTLESMKMENPIITTVSGKVVEVGVSEGETVEAGRILAVIEY
ncbi:MAG: biotin/lipoyl-binding protein, partial [Dehalococcoidales bacterium]|nr:biotin/lipoyl-binding protein [Dehalococcoidales bacterium]